VLLRSTSNRVLITSPGDCPGGTIRLDEATKFISCGV
jgi:hypothetical protein